MPGAGLGRLAFEIAQAGFICEGNEFSYYTLVCSSFVLNCFEAEEEWALHPWVHNTCNVGRDEDQVRMVRVPVVLPLPNTIPHGFSMCAGDFLEVYSHPSQAGENTVSTKKMFKVVTDGIFERKPRFFCQIFCCEAQICLHLMSQCAK